MYRRAMGMFQFRVALTAAVALLVSAVPASADPVSADPVGTAPVPTTPGAPAAPATVPAAGTYPPGVAPAAFVPPVDAGRVESAPPSTSTLEGVTLTISAKDETQQSVAPLTTAISTREYLVGGVFSGSITGTATPPEGVLEVGYQIGCGIDMSTSGGVLIGGAVQGAIGTDALLGGLGGFTFPPIGIVGAGAGVTGQVGVNLKPGIVNNVPVTKKTYKGPNPEVEIRNFRVKIDGCVGQSFIRSYATLANSGAQVEDIVSWFGVTKAV
jgi:hypothetical protein